MKYYLCQTDDGPQYAGTQAEAKKLDKDFEIVDLDFSKPAMMERLNNLMAQLHEKGGEPHERTAFEGDVGTFEEGNQPKRTEGRTEGEPRFDPQAEDIRAGKRCPVCETRKSIAHWAASSEAEVAVAEILPSITHLPHLDAIFDQIEEQHDHLRENASGN